MLNTMTKPKVTLYRKEAGSGQTFITASVAANSEPFQAAESAYSLIAAHLIEHGLEIVHERTFGSLCFEPLIRIIRERALKDNGIVSDGPVTYIQGQPTWGERFSGIIIHAVAAEKTWTIRDGNIPCGRGWRRNASTYIMLQNITGDNNPPQSPLNLREDTIGHERSLQTRRMFERAERVLRDNDASYRNVARTWLYLSKILQWYPEFNKARSEKYGEFGIMPGPGDEELLLPASTAVGADTSSGAAASMDLLAVVNDRKARQLSNKKQLDAFRYGAAFSRGAVIKEDDVNIIQISGTAAIDEHGVSLYPDDIFSQINCTLDRIETLLSQEGAGLRDIAAATVFVKSPEYAPVFREVVKDRGIADFPAVCIVADICREELLFEIDAEAVVRKEPV